MLATTTQLNTPGIALGTMAAVHALTDVTGFGLIGHGTEMAAASGVTLEIDAGRVPMFTGVVELARQNRSGGLTSNQEYYAAGVSVATGGSGEHDEDVLSLLYDPQTSGGLLISAAAEWSDHVAAALENAGVRAARIGRARGKTQGVHIDVRP